MARKRTPGLVKRGAVWHVDKVIGGRRIVESTGASDLAEAERYLAHRLAEHRALHVYGERPRVTVRMAAEKYLDGYCPAASLRRAGDALEHFMSSIGDTEIGMVHDGALEPYRAERRAAGAAPGTINKELSVLGRVLQLAARVWRHENGRTYLDAPPLLRREPERAVYLPYPLSWDEQKRLLSELPGSMATQTLFAINTGARQEEFCGLRWDWRVKVPELGVCVFVLPAAVTKTRTERVLVLNSVARRIVETCEGEHPEYVFVTRDGKRRGRLNNPTWQVARVKAGVPTLRVHDLRHTFGHRLRAAGVGLEDRADLLGHSAGRMTTHYSAPDLARLLEAAERVVEERPATVLRAVGG